MRVIIPYLEYLGPAWFRRWLLDMTPNKALQHLKSIADIMNRHSLAIFEEKKALIESGDDALLNQVGEGRDIMSVLRKLSCTLRHELLGSRAELTYPSSEGEHARI